MTTHAATPTTMAHRTAAVQGAPPAAPAAAPAGPDGSASPRDGSASEVRRHELAAFLRSRRARISPEQAGLPRGPRRRTPGLRREEVAHLSAVGVTWYTWLEQARDIQVSVQVLDALARTLRLDTSERAHLFNLAAAVDPAPGSNCAPVTAAQRLLLEQLEPLPACIQNSRYDILAYNSTYGLLLCDLASVAPTDLNCMILCATNQEWRDSLVNAEEVMRIMAAKFRASMAEHLAEPAWKVLLNRLHAESPEFRDAWERHEIVSPHGKRKQFRNPRVGLLTVDHTDLWFGPHNGLRMVTYAPADSESRERLERLHEIALERRPAGRA
ncbi:helix-turn-helix transcriptional regulator [Streptomyces sp. NPDC008313]|uniref:helix-turn-helix transcriptional regulator n=1 Tax=Streptomyces sp. NPDC008313 TaxID=3364826 RepID=UPI0036EA8355